MRRRQRPDVAVEVGLQVQQQEVVVGAARDQRVAAAGRASRRAPRRFATTWRLYGGPSRCRAAAKQTAWRRSCASAARPACRGRRRQSTFFASSARHRLNPRAGRERLVRGRRDGCLRAHGGGGRRRRRGPDVGHVDHETARPLRRAIARNAAKSKCRGSPSAGHDQLRSMLERELANFVHVDPSVPDRAVRHEV